MKKEVTDLFLTKIADLIDEFDEVVNAQIIDQQAGAWYETWHYVPSTRQVKFITAATSIIEKVAGSNSSYCTTTRESFKAYYPGRVEVLLPIILGVLEALKEELTAGYLNSVEEIINANLFSDFLEMSQHLLQEGYKDAAAVMVGGVLEQHLKNLGTKNGIALNFLDNKGGSQQKKADTLNADLAKARVYSLAEQKQVTAWLDLRNKAAHAMYHEYNKEQIDLFLKGLRNFIASNPA